MSKRSFGLNIDTLNQLYISLIRSILEYSTILFPLMSISSLNKLNIIQNKAIKIINRKSIYSRTSDINSAIENLEDRFNVLNIRYFQKAILNENEIIIELINDYKIYKSNKTIKQNTI